MITNCELKQNYENLILKIREAEKAADRPVGSVELLPAVKYATAEQINFLHSECGLSVIGENRVQTLLDHWEKLEDRNGFGIHFIGSLQKNKVKYIIDKVSLIHSVDSLSLAEEIDRQAKKHGITADVLIEINSGMEESKSGVMPDRARDLSLCVNSLENVRIRGFMTMGPKFDTERERYDNFLKTSELALDIWRETLHNIGMPLMSMGMTDSYVPAIAAGADIIRIGRAIFGMDAKPVTENEKK